MFKDFLWCKNMLTRNDIIHELSKLGFKKKADLLVCTRNNKRIEVAYAISIVRTLNKKYNLRQAVDILCLSMNESDKNYFSWMTNKLNLNTSNLKTDESLMH